MKFNLKYLYCLFSLLLTESLFSQEMKNEVNFEYGVFEYKYLIDTNLKSPKKQISITLTMVNFGEILIFHKTSKNKKDFDLISARNNNCKVNEIESNLDTLELIYSFIHFNLSDTAKIFTSVPYSDLLTLKKHPNYYIYCNFNYLDCDWVAKITLNNEMIVNLSLFRYNREKRIVLDEIGRVKLVKKITGK